MYQKLWTLSCLFLVPGAVEAVMEDEGPKYTFANIDWRVVEDRLKRCS